MIETIFIYNNNNIVYTPYSMGAAPNSNKITNNLYYLLKTIILTTQ